VTTKMIDVERLALIGDVHLEDGDDALEPFCAMLGDVAARCDRLVLMGDLFNLWVGQEVMQLSHHRRVVEALRQVRRSGVAVDYVEGNRDYRIGKLFERDAFDHVWTDGVAYRVGDRSVWAIHGDLTNPNDQQYRRWRRWSRGRLLWGLLNLIPQRSRQRVADSLELRMRRTNQEFKREFPTEAVLRYGQRFLQAGCTDVVLGHFHIERELESSEPAGRVWVLPEWKGSRRHLEVDQDELRFVEEAGGGEEAGE